MKRILLALAAAILLVNTVVIPAVANAEGVGATNCGGHGLCKP